MESTKVPSQSKITASKPFRGNEIAPTLAMAAHCVAVRTGNGKDYLSIIALICEFGRARRWRGAFSMPARCE
jgi:hypothetical protein